VPLSGLERLAASDTASVCGQGLIGRKIDPKPVNPDVQIDFWAMTRCSTCS